MRMRGRKASSITVRSSTIGGVDMIISKNIFVSLSFLLLIIFSSLLFSEKVLFVYNGNPESSLWNLSHRMGETYFSKTFPKVEVKDLVLSNTSKDVFTTEVSETNFELIFITDPTLEDLLKNLPQEILDKVWICNGENHKAYYLKDYQAAFLLGVVAGLYSNGKKVAVLIDSKDNGIYFRLVDSLFLGLKEAGYNNELEVFELSGKNPDEFLPSLKEYSIVVNLSINTGITQKLESLGIDNLGFYVDQSMEGKKHNLMNLILNWGPVYSKIYTENKMNAKYLKKRVFGFENRALMFSPISFKVSYKIFNIADYFKKKMISNEYKIFKGKLVDTNDHEFSIDSSQELEIFKLDKFLKGVVIK